MADSYHAGDAFVNDIPKNIEIIEWLIDRRRIVVT
jgi:hypothetical protein